MSTIRLCSATTPKVAAKRRTSPDGHTCCLPDRRDSQSYYVNWRNARGAALGTLKGGRDDTGRTWC